MERQSAGRLVRRILTLGFAACVVLLASPQQSAQADNGRGQRLAHLAAGQPTLPPIGWVQFCRDNPVDCRNGPSRGERAILTPGAFADLARLNLEINRQIEPVTDLDQYGTQEHWTYPNSGKGDCEDYVLLKKQRLIAAGWPASSLLITVVRDRRGDGHAVLTVVTDRGDYILDNQVNDILLWHATGYGFVKRQSQTDPNRWVMIGPAATPGAVAAR